MRSVRRPRHDNEELVKLAADEQAELEAAIDEAERDGGITAEESLREIGSILYGDRNAQ